MRSPSQLKSDCYIPTDCETGRKRGFAFVELESEANEDQAIQALDRAEWMGRELKVNKARPRENRSSFAGSYRSNRFKLLSSN